MIKSKILLIPSLFILILLPAITHAGYFVNPVDSPVSITGYFDHEQNSVGNEVYFDGTGDHDYDEHNGTDFDGDYGDDILAAESGVVEDVYWNNDGGWTVHVWHATSGLSTLYAHVATTTVATTSDVVAQGEHIAEMDSTGAASEGSHLHFGVVDSQYLSGHRIDPFGWWAETTDPWSYNQGYLWTTYPPSSNTASTVPSTISSDQTWRGNYYISGTVTIATGTTITVTPGTVVKFSTNGKLVVNGTLDAQGTETQPIYFTSYKDDQAGGDTNGDGSPTSPAPGDWYEIVVNTGGVVTMDHTVSRYGGGTSATYDAIIADNGGLVTVTNSVVASSTNYAVRHLSGTTTVATTTISNSGYGFYGAGTGMLSMIANTFVENNVLGSISSTATFVFNSIANRPLSHPPHHTAYCKE